MRLASTLSETDLPLAELQAAVLDGELTPVGRAFCAIDTIVDSQQRAAALATEVPSWSIAERHTAGWMYGLVDRQPDQLQLCVTRESKIRPFSCQRLFFREVILEDSDVVRISGLNATSPLRTALDIARIDDEFTKKTSELLRGLAEIGSGFTIEQCEAALARRRNLPHKRLALARLTLALSGSSYH